MNVKEKLEKEVKMNNTSVNAISEGVLMLGFNRPLCFPFEGAGVFVALCRLIGFSLSPRRSGPDHQSQRSKS